MIIFSSFKSSKIQRLNYYSRNEKDNVDNCITINLWLITFTSMLFGRHLYSEWFTYVSFVYNQAVEVLAQGLHSGNLVMMGFELMTIWCLMSYPLSYHFVNLQLEHLTTIQIWEFNHAVVCTKKSSVCIRSKLHSTYITKALGLFFSTYFLNILFSKCKLFSCPHRHSILGHLKMKPFKKTLYGGKKLHLGEENNCFTASSFAAQLRVLEMRQDSAEQVVSL